MTGLRLHIMQAGAIVQRQRDMRPAQVVRRQGLNPDDFKLGKYIQIDPIHTSALIALMEATLKQRQEHSHATATPSQRL